MLVSKLLDGMGEEKSDLEENSDQYDSLVPPKDVETELLVGGKDAELTSNL